MAGLLRYLPAQPLVDAVAAALRDPGGRLLAVPGHDLVVLAGWTVAGLLAGLRFFRWVPQVPARSRRPAGFRAREGTFDHLKLARSGSGAHPYRWPLYFFTAVAFWNLLGAGVFGFLINPPIVLYYAQGINTTPIHSHGALFGVYGFLAIALCCSRSGTSSR